MERKTLATATPAITVRLRVSPVLRHRLSAFAGSHEIELALAQGATVRDVAAWVGLDLEAEGLVCGVNSRLAGPDTQLCDGDRVHLMHPVAGGCSAARGRR